MGALYRRIISEIVMESQEIDLINDLADCWNKYCQLEVQHPNDSRDFADAIHTCQRIVMSREAVRQNPEIFPIRRAQ